MSKIDLDIRVSTDELIDSLRYLQYEDLIDFISKLDLMIADVGFTENLIKVLVKSMKADKDDVSLKFIKWDKV